MKARMAARCIDINSPYCPCLLAETNHCITCSHLKGEELCNCDWSGLCILNEKRWQAKRNEWRGAEAPIRVENETELKIVRKITDNTYILDLNVSADLARELAKPGSFVFLKRPSDPDFYFFPVGIMKTIASTLRVAIEVTGPKSVRLLNDNNTKVLVRGPYRNGVLGQPWIDTLSYGKILLVAGGMGQSPAVHIAEFLAGSNNKIHAILAPGKIGAIFIDDDLKALGAEVTVIPSMRREGMAMLDLLFHHYDTLPDLVVSAGPDDQHFAVIAAMNGSGVNLPMAATNNATMCCGEGICGSCEKETRDGRKIRTCKVQISFDQLKNPAF